LPAIFKTAYYRADPNNSAVSKVDKLFVNTAGFLDYGGYGDRAGYKPTSTDTPTIYLSGRSKQMTATL
jgi:antirestriction protein ArdC